MAVLMKKTEYIIIGLVITLGVVSFGGWRYVKHQDYLKQQAIVSQQSDGDGSATQPLQLETTPPQVQNTNQQALQTCINNANQQEISQLQDEKDTIAEDNASGAYYDTDTVNSYVQEIQQQAQTQITECQADYPQN